MSSPVPFLPPVLEIINQIVIREKGKSWEGVKLIFDVISLT